MNKKKILITGGSGFIGKSLIDQFSASDEFEITAVYRFGTPLIRKNVTWVKSDLLEEKGHEKIYDNIEVVVMCAAISAGAKYILEKPEIFVFNNSRINELTLAAAVKAGVKHIVFPSCSIMYGNSLLPQTEVDVRLDTIHPAYVGGAHMKLYIEGLCKFYSLNSDTKFSVVRHSNCYGPYDKYDKDKSHVFAATLIKVMAKSNELEIWGTGEEGRDFMHVEDLVRLIHILLTSQKVKYELVCCGSGKLISIKDLAAMALKITGIDKKLKINPGMPTLPINIVLDSSKAKSVYGWFPKIGLEEGISRTFNWLKHAEFTKNL